MAKHVVCVSWFPELALTREILLTRAGCRVTSVLGEAELNNLSKISDTDLLVLAHSIPRERKQWAISVFQQHCGSPILSLLEPHQTKLSGADFGAEAMNPDEVVEVVRSILGYQ